MGEEESMVKLVQGDLDARGLRIGIVLSRFNEVFGQRLLEAAVDTLERHGAAGADITVVRVPGAFELPAAARRMALGGGVDAVIALGVVIRGATPHFEHVAAEAARGIGEAARCGGAPVLFGVVTAETQDQALERCGGKMGNRGRDAALAAIEMARLVRALGGGTGAPPRS
jgi:6,7-dimethyl-8-ribityllumazine synthase